MLKRNTPDETTEMIRQSVLETKVKKQKDKYCVRDFSGDIFELTTDMLVKEHYFNKEENSDLAGVAECILRKYEKLLSVK
ncbi:MAG: hypothetical protein IKW58_03275 [Alphaproteobacteria bacterium]|jgi:hypothetical protein|nr:hypothetical protein [Alphaproteobacteria bacterium]